MLLCFKHLWKGLERRLFQRRGNWRRLSYASEGLGWKLGVIIKGLELEERCSRDAVLPWRWLIRAGCLFFR
eukprot:520421-Rhodomonas_salina.1